MHKRKLLRLKNYDYSMPGAYFITICTKNRECLFGDVVDDEMVLNGNEIVWAKNFLPQHENRFHSPKQTIGSIVRSFKLAVAKHINQIRQSHGKPVWQRNYYEHIVRNDLDLYRIRQYILDNPKKWEKDKNYIF